MPGIVLKRLSFMISYQGLANVSCKGAKVKVLGLVSHKVSQLTHLPLRCEKSHRGHVNQQVCICSRKLHFLDAGLCVSDNFHVSQNILLPLIFFPHNHLACKNHFSLVSCTKGRSGLDLGQGLWFSDPRLLSTLRDAIILPSLHMRKSSL